MLREDSGPSMKSKVSNESAKVSKDEMEDYYTIFLVFDMNIKNILFYPCSMRGYYDGCNACSHFTEFLLLIRCIQRCDFNQELFEQLFPENPSKSQNCNTLIVHVGFSDEYKIVKIKKWNKLQLLSNNENSNAVI